MPRTVTVVSCRGLSCARISPLVLTREISVLPEVRIAFFGRPLFERDPNVPRALRPLLPAAMSMPYDTSAGSIPAGLRPAPAPVSAASGTWPSVFVCLSVTAESRGGYGTTEGTNGIATFIPARTPSWGFTQSTRVYVPSGVSNDAQSALMQ